MTHIQFSETLKYTKTIKFQLEDQTLDTKSKKEENKNLLSRRFCRFSRLESENKRKRAEKVGEHEGDGDTNCSKSAWNCL